MDSTGSLRIAVVNGIFENPISPPAGDGDVKEWVAILRPTLDGTPFERDFVWDGDDERRGTHSAGKLRVGEAIEFGCDLWSDGPKGGKRTEQITNRCYAVIRVIQPEYIQVDRYQDAYAAIGATDRARSRARGEGKSVAQLTERRDQLEVLVSSLSEELKEVEAQLAIEYHRSRAALLARVLP
jgi:hypothetical protein